jgi:hypothetical protein
MDERLTLNIEIANLTPAQALAIEDMLATWMQLACAGSSRWTCFYADGDGNFHPRIKVDGKPPGHCKLDVPVERWKKNPYMGSEVYLIDYDTVAWALTRIKEQEQRRLDEEESEDKR